MNNVYRLSVAKLPCPAKIIAVNIATTWLINSYERMKSDCEKMGGSFYSISFNQNICVEGSIVHELN